MITVLRDLCENHKMKSDALAARVNTFLTKNHKFLKTTKFDNAV
jgi:hypothetical protein